MVGIPVTPGQVSEARGETNRSDRHKDEVSTAKAAEASTGGGQGYGRLSLRPWALGISTPEIAVRGGAGGGRRQVNGGSEAVGRRGSGCGVGGGGVRGVGGFSSGGVQRCCFYCRRLRMGVA